MYKVVVIAGGIGSGKSVVSQALRTMGYPVYDCDSAAKKLMDGSDELKRRLVEAFGPDVVKDGAINRKQLGAIIFTSDEARLKVNSIVHPAVEQDFLQWAEAQKTGLVGLETAIPRESGLHKIAAEVWQVEAPLEVRIERVKRRDSLTESQILGRIQSQQGERLEGKNVIAIYNDGNTPLIPQIENRINKLI